jgi:hypothetical protein
LLSLRHKATLEGTEWAYEVIHCARHVSKSERVFGWGKHHGTMRKTKHRGIAPVDADFLLNLIAYNRIHIPKLLAA